MFLSLLPFGLRSFPVDQRLATFQLDVDRNRGANLHGILGEREHDGRSVHRSDALELRTRAREGEDALRDVFDDGVKRLTGGARALRNDTEELAADFELGHGRQEGFLRLAGDDVDGEQLAGVARVGCDLKLDREAAALLDALLHRRRELEEEGLLRLLLDDDVVRGFALDLRRAELDRALVRVAGAEHVRDDLGVVVGGDHLRGHLLARVVRVGDDLELDPHARLDAVLEDGGDLPPEFALGGVFANEGEEALLALLRFLLDLARVLLAFVELDHDVLSRGGFAGCLAAGSSCAESLV